MILDSGNRRQFSTGAVRDIQEGKGREDLLPLKEVAEFTRSKVLESLYRFEKTLEPGFIREAMYLFCKENGWDMWTAMLEVGIHFEEGAKKYGDNNWRKGINIHCYLDSALRHYFKHRRGDKDEPHDRAFLWNLLCLQWTMLNRPEMMDLEREWGCTQCEYCKKHPKTQRYVCGNEHSSKHLEEVSGSAVCDLFKEF